MIDLPPNVHVQVRPCTSNWSACTGPSPTFIIHGRSFTMTPCLFSSERGRPGWRGGKRLLTGAHDRLVYLSTLLPFVTVLTVLEARQISYPGTGFVQRPASAPHGSALHPLPRRRPTPRTRPTHPVSSAREDVDRRSDEHVLPTLVPHLRCFVHYRWCYEDDGLWAPFSHHGIVTPEENAPCLHHRNCKSGVDPHIRHG
jgi:hypothetical protein